MNYRYLFIIIVFILTLFTACDQDIESKELIDKPKMEKMQTVEKLINIEYVDVYLNQNILVSGNPNTGIVVVPFQSEDIVYLPVNVFAEKNNNRQVEWDNEKKELTIGKANTYSHKGSYRFPDNYPEQITVSYGGISLYMQDEEIPLNESEQLIVFENTVYAKAELLCVIFDKDMKKCEKSIALSSGDLQYSYVNISNDLTIPIDFPIQYFESDLYKLTHP